MTVERDRVLAELPLPLDPEATSADALRLAVAIEDGCGGVIPDELITVEHLASRESVMAVLDGLGT